VVHCGRRVLDACLPATLADPATRALSEARPLPKPFAVILAIAAVVVGFLLFEPNTSAAKPAENFRLYTTSGKLVSLDEYRGKIVVLDFFATWCSPCQRAVPDLERIHELYHDNGVVVLGVNVHDNNDPLEFANRHAIPYPILLHGEQVADAYGVSGIPAFVVISPEGDIVFRESGWSPRVMRDLTEAVDQQLARLGR
jgi:cytochrome c biogenesis protein CcmG/thiol:disulfide interchange protein DsbE